MKRVVYISPHEWERLKEFLPDWVPMVVEGRIGDDDVIVGYRPLLLGM